MSRTINDLRDAMFDTLEKLKAGTISIEQAKAAGDIGQVIINSAKLEVEYIRATENGKSTFIEAQAEALPPGITGITKHRIGG